MNDSQIKIRRGKIEDAEKLAPLAIKIFNDTFAGNPLNKPEDMRAYIAEAFSLEQIRHELIDQEMIIFIVEADNRMIGFAKLLEHSIEECVDDKDPIEIQRFYIAGEYHGRGIAQKLMEECLAVARLKQYKTIWLGVWEFNHRAQRFYEKLGFEKVGTHIFQLGNDPQTDWVMAKNL
jgi:ribosomal protein S18 acetylase RimI-like enzyme